VQSVNQGAVRLAGTVPTLSAHARAVEVVTHVPGVRHVASKIHSPDILADAEIWREPTTRQPREAYGVREAASDMWITSETKMRLLADSQTPALDINVDTRTGVVTLFGIVPSQNAKAAAAADTRRVSGVKRVVNDLQVVASPKQAAVKARDEELAHAVRQAFEPPAFKDITVAVKNGVVRLRGTVATGARRLEAAMAARAIPGGRSKMICIWRPPRRHKVRDHAKGLHRRAAGAEGRCSLGAHKGNNDGWQDRPDERAHQRGRWGAHG
jgi:osmotically-inducible protein OsmY